MYRLDIPMPSPIDFGICNGGASVYTLLSWIEGEEAEKVIPKLPAENQYLLGKESGKILRKIHTLKGPQNSADWETRYFGVIDECLEAFREEGASSVSAMTSIVWAKYFAPDRLSSILELNKDILKWFDHMQSVMPSWYMQVK